MFFDDTSILLMVILRTMFFFEFLFLLEFYLFPRSSILESCNSFSKFLFASGKDIFL